MDIPSNISQIVKEGEGVDDCDDECWDLYIGFWIEGLLVPAIAVFGIVGNITCVFVFNHKSVDLKPSFSNILKCLSIYEMALLVGQNRSRFTRSLLRFISAPNLSILRFKIFFDRNAEFV